MKVPSLAVLCSTLILTGCLTSGTETKVTSGADAPNINEMQAEAYDGPKARVAVTRFVNKTLSRNWFNNEIGTGMAAQLATALVNSNRFVVLERRHLDDVLAEQNLGASGRVRGSTAAAIGEIEGAELLITGAVTEFQRGTSGSTGGGFRGGGTAGLIGAVLGAVASGVKRSHIAIDIRIIDARTSRIVAATSVEGTVTDFNVGGAAGGFLGNAAVGGALATWQKEPIGKALRLAIANAVKFISSKTPPVYYRHDAGAGTARALPEANPQKLGAEARLAELKELYGKKLVSEEEYDQRRKRILDSI